MSDIRGAVAPGLRQLPGVIPTKDSNLVSFNTKRLAERLSLCLVVSIQVVKELVEVP